TRFRRRRGSGPSPEPFPGRAEGRPRQRRAWGFPSTPAPHRTPRSARGRRSPPPEPPWAACPAPPGPTTTGPAPAAGSASASSPPGERGAPLRYSRFPARCLLLHVLQEPLVQILLLIGLVPGVVAHAGVDRELRVSPRGLDGVDHVLGALDGHGRVLVAVEIPDREVLDLRGVRGVPAAADRGGGGEQVG